MLARSRIGLTSMAKRIRVAPASRHFSTELMEEVESTYSLALSDEQKSFQELARSFALNEMIPVAAHYDTSMEFPTPVFNKAWELGLVNTHIPEDYGGLGLGCFEGVIIGEELAYGCTGDGGQRGLAPTGHPRRGTHEPADSRASRSRPHMV